MKLSFLIFCVASVLWLAQAWADEPLALDNKSWLPFINIEEVVVSDQEIAGRIKNIDPYFINEKFAPFQATGLSVVCFDMLVPKGSGKAGAIFWTRAEDKGMSPERRVGFKVSDDGEWHSYAVDMGVNSGWSGVIKALRIDPLDPPAALGVFRFRNCVIK